MCALFTYPIKKDRKRVVCPLFDFRSLLLRLVIAHIIWRSHVIVCVAKHPTLFLSLLTSCLSWVNALHLYLEFCVIIHISTHAHAHHLGHYRKGDKLKILLTCYLNRKSTLRPKKGLIIMLITKTIEYAGLLFIGLLSLVQISGWDRALKEC